MACQPTVTGQEAKAYLAETVNPVLLKGLTELCQQKPSDPIVSFDCLMCPHIFRIINFNFLQLWLADWLLLNNPNKSNADVMPTDDDNYEPVLNATTF